MKFQIEKEKSIDMTTFMNSESQRPGSSSRIYNHGNSFVENSQRKLRFQTKPMRCYSLEGKGNPTRERTNSNSRYQGSSTSMIPRPERKNPKKASIPDTCGKMDKLSEEEKHTNDVVEEVEKREKVLTEEEEKDKEMTVGCSSGSIASLESKVSEDFQKFKNTVMMIPEFWADASQTVTNILQNTISIIAKQYPSVDVETLKMEIHNILKATTVVKEEILTKSESIINQANKMYSEDVNEEEEGDDVIRMIFDKLESDGISDSKKKQLERRQLSQLKNLIKYKKESLRETENGEETEEKTEEENNEILKKPKSKVTLNRNRYDNGDEDDESSSAVAVKTIMDTFKNEEMSDLNRMQIERSQLSQLRRIVKHERRVLNGAQNAREEEETEKTEEDDKNEMSGVTISEKYRNRDDKNLPCGDGVVETSTVAAKTGKKSSTDVKPILEDKPSQTIATWTAELHSREWALSLLKNQIDELHAMCKNHISKFKNFNLEIKLRGNSSRVQTKSVEYQLQALLDEKNKLEEKNNSLEFYNKDLESALKQREVDIDQKEKLINQQKKLLEVRDELIDMLKSKCNKEGS